MYSGGAISIDSFINNKLYVEIVDNTLCCLQKS